MTTVARRFARLAQIAPDRLAVPAMHTHVWRPLAGAVGVSCCRAPRCLWCAVCPGCLKSIDIALRLAEGVPGVLLVWCALHQPPAPRCAWCLVEEGRSLGDGSHGICDRHRAALSGARREGGAS